MSARTSIRLLRTGIVPDGELEHLSVGYSRIALHVGERLTALRSGQDPLPLFIKGEWGAGKSHCLAYVRAAASKQGVPCSLVCLDGRSTPLNYPQRFYPILAGSIRCRENLLGLRELMSRWLTEVPVRQAIKAFAVGPSAGLFRWSLDTLCRLFERSESLDLDTVAWSLLLGGDLAWADYSYKREEALNRIETLGAMFRYLGIGGLVAPFDEAETIDQLWNYPARLTAYSVLGRLCKMKATWCVFAVTERFGRMVKEDIGRGALYHSSLSENGRQFLKRWAQSAFEVLEAPRIDRSSALKLAASVVHLYHRAYGLPPDYGVVARCVYEWARSETRNPRRLIRLVVHSLDIRRAIA